MKKIKIFLDPVLYIMEDTSVFSGYHYVDLTNGEIISPDSDDAVNNEDLEDSERYFPIEPITSHDSFEIMQNFAEELDSDEIRDYLFDALSKKKPFRKFKDALIDYPDIEKNFYEYKDNILKEIFKNRLFEYGYELDE